jgi:hypothetical protein
MALFRISVFPLLTVNSCWKSRRFTGWYISNGHLTRFIVSCLFDCDTDILCIREVMRTETFTIWVCLVIVKHYQITNLNIRPPMSTSSICDSCVQESPQVYAQSWACLNPSCNKFWITLDDQPLPDQLDYNPRFLELLPEIQPSKGYGRLLPSPPLVHPTNEAITNYRFSRGWHCSKCGRLSCRLWNLQIKR